jgi:hypothetical protein
MATPFSNKCQILGELWVSFKDDEQFSQFFIYNDLGLPLAYVIANELVTPTEEAEKFVEETWDMFAEALELDNDKVYEDLDTLFDENYKKHNPGE